MSLVIQIKSIFLCFIYGMFFTFSFYINKDILLSKNLLYKITINILFVIDHVLIFFILIKFINNSILHIYYIPPFVFGIYFYKYYFTHVEK